MFSSDGRILMTTPCEIKKAKDYSKQLIVFSSNSIDECKSFLSYIDSKFVRFLILLRYGRNSVNNNFSWSFVPDPGSFDHIFTDQELYQKYNLTPDEINIIESVIKERKEK